MDSWVWDVCWGYGSRAAEGLDVAAIGGVARVAPEVHIWLPACSVENNASADVGEL